MTLYMALLGLAISSVWLTGPLPGAPTRIAVGADGTIFVGGARGVDRFSGSGLEPVLEDGSAVLDLVPAGDQLWIATERGLLHWTPGAGIGAEPPLAPGADLRAVAWSEGRLYAATGAGLFSGTAGAFARETSLPPGAVDSVRASGGDVWVARRGTLYQRAADGRFVPRVRAQPPGWWELLAVLPDSLLVVPEGLWRAGDPAPRRLEPIARPPLRAGAMAGRSAPAPGVAVVVSEGELAVLGPEPHPLAIPELGAAEILDLAARPSDASVLLLTGQGVLQVRFDDASATRPLAEAAPRQPLADAAPRRPAAADGAGLRSSVGSELEDVPIAALHRAVLAYLELEATRMHGLERRARRSLWLPEVRFTSGVDLDRGRTLQRNQVFNTGSVRDLAEGGIDQQNGRNVELQLVWNLAGGVDPKPLLDVSRERRELIELRDQVLERVDRIYFERLRVRARVALLPEAAPERTELWIRERELCAQLDGWSGGAFSELLHTRGSARGKQLR